MPVFDENDATINDFEGRPGFTRARSGRSGAWSIEKPRSILRKIPILPIILIMLVVMVGIKLFLLEAKISELKNEVSQVTGSREQMTDLQNGFNARIAAVNKEQRKLQSEIGHLRGEIEATKSRQKHQAEAAAQKQLAEAKKKAEKPAPVKKPNGKERRV
jgi:hypothetical protein